MINIKGTFVPFLGAVIRGEKPQQRGSALSFTLSGAWAGEIVEERGGRISRRISKSRGEYFYILGEELSAADKKLAEMAKADLIDFASAAPEEIGLETAFNYSYGKLAGNAKAEMLAYLISHDTVGNGPLGILLEDKAVIEEIEVSTPTGPISVYTSNYGRCRTNISFTGEEAFRHTINKFIYEQDKELNDASPVIDVQVNEARVHAQVKPYASSGAAASIRIGGGKEIGIKAMLSGRSLDANILAYLSMAVEARMNMVVAGAPASGKTTLLSLIGSFISKQSKLVVIEEDINELRFEEPVMNVTSLYGSRFGNVNPSEQVINALRLRPDRIIIGEIRGREASELFSGANLGIPFITTMHSNEENLAIIKRLISKPMSVEARSMSMLDLAVYMRQSGVRSRIVSSIKEYLWFSRAETEAGMDLGEGESVEEKTVAKDGVMPPECIGDSKVITCYAKFAAITYKSALREFRRRAAEYGKYTLPEG